jgi:ATP-dependent DNA ligase
LVLSTFFFERAAPGASIPEGGIVSKRLGSIYRRGRSPHWLKVKNPNAPVVKREAEEDWP